MEMNKAAIVAKYLLIIINSIYIVLGILVVTAGFMICYKEDMNPSFHALGRVVISIGVVNMIVAGLGFVGAMKEKTSVLKIYTGVVIAGIIVKTVIVALLYTSNKMQQLPSGFLLGSVIEYFVEIFIIACSIYLLDRIKHYRSTTYSQFNMG